MRDGMIAIFGIMFVVTMTAYLVAADTVCTSQDCSVGASLTVGNSNPIVIAVQDGISVTGTGESSVAVEVLFNATDANGFGDLNDSTAQCIGYKTGDLNRTTSSCTAQDQSGNDLAYNCTVAFQYFDSAGADWNWDCSVSDNFGLSANNNTVNFTINALNYVDVNVTTVTWSSVTPNVDDQEANAPINLDNGGNQDYESANVTAYDAQNNSDLIPASAFSLDADTGQTVGQTSMANNTAVEISSFFTLQHGDGATEDLFTYVNVPALTSGTYTSTSNWLIDIFA